MPFHARHELVVLLLESLRTRCLLPGSSAQPSSAAKFPFVRSLLLILCVLTVLLLAILVLHLRAVWRSHAYYSITGGDTLCAYGIWKVQEGSPLYEWPNQEFYQLAFYNAASNHSYGRSPEGLWCEWTSHLAFWSLPDRGVYLAGDIR